MRFIETDHFLQRWASRVGDYYPRVRNAIKRSVVAGNTLRLRDENRGLLIPVKYEGNTWCVLGVPHEDYFVLRTVMDPTMASRMGWGC